MRVYVHEWQREKDPKFVSFFVSSKSVSMQYNWMNSDFILWKMWSFLGIPVSNVLSRGQREHGNNPDM